jgi:hypothetical protein
LYPIQKLCHDKFRDSIYEALTCHINTQITSQFRIRLMPPVIKLSRPVNILKPFPEPTGFLVKDIDKY